MLNKYGNLINIHSNSEYYGAAIWLTRHNLIYIALI